MVPLKNLSKNTKPNYQFRFLFTCIVNRVLSNSRGYVTKVELTPAHAPATRDAGIGILGCSPGMGDKFLLTVS